MARKRHSDEDVLKLLREIELKLTAGDDVVTACRSVGISDATYYTWRKKFGSMGRSQLAELKAPDGTLITKDQLPAGVEFEGGEASGSYKLAAPAPGEWTAVLTPQETEEIFAVLRRLADDGHSIVFISRC